MSLAQLLVEYEEDHRHPLNQRAHMIGIPLILLALPLLIIDSRVALAAFVLGWIFQFVGHAIEGRRPAFTRNAAHLMVGPVFVARKFLDQVINDVSTTPADPPKFIKGDRPVPPRFRGAQERAYPWLAPLALKSSATASFAKVLETAKAMPRWTIVASDPARRIVQALATTPLLSFKDDIIITVAPAGSGSVVHMRSRSRLGKGDYGANAKRIRAFLKQLTP